MVNEPSVQRGHELLNRFEFHYEPSSNWNFYGAITFPRRNTSEIIKVVVTVDPLHRKCKVTTFRPRFCEGNQEENCSWAVFFLNQFQKYIFHSLYDIPRVQARVDSRSQEENFIPPQIAYIYIYIKSLSPIAKLAEYLLYSLRAGKLNAPLSMFHSQRSTLHETLAPGDTLTAFKNVLNTDPVFSTAPFFQILARIPNWNSPERFASLSFTSSTSSLIKSDTIEVKIHYPKTFESKKEEKREREEITSKVFLFAFQIYHALHRREKMELQIVWIIIVWEFGSNFTDDASSNLSSSVILRQAGQHRETRLIIDRQLSNYCWIDIASGTVEVWNSVYPVARFKQLWPRQFGKSGLYLGQSGRRARTLAVVKVEKVFG